MIALHQQREAAPRLGPGHPHLLDASASDTGRGGPAHAHASGTGTYRDDGTCVPPHGPSPATSRHSQDTATASRRGRPTGRRAAGPSSVRHGPRATASSVPKSRTCHPDADRRNRHQGLHADDGILDTWRSRAFRRQALTSSPRMRSSNTFRPSGIISRSILKECRCRTGIGRSWLNGSPRTAAVK